MSRPLIAVSGTIRVFDGAGRAGVNAAYVLSTARAGGIPVLLTPAIGADAAADAMSGVHGLLLTGGHDIDPACYGAPPSPELGPVDRARDEFEIALFHAARAAHIPILGVCRGLQLINIAMGGTLWQDLPSECSSSVDHNPAVVRDARVHGIRVNPASSLRSVLGAESFETNSFHHQAVRDIAPGLVATAWAPDGVIEGVEIGNNTGEWLLAVQWHPEEFHRAPATPDQRLFDAFVRAAREGAGRVSAIRGRRQAVS